MSGQAKYQNSWLRPLARRDPGEHHRAATPLELLYDLVLVIAVGAAAGGLHHAINENHVGDGVFVYFFMFWALWWPWMNFTWFASAYDNDDVLYRCLVFLQMVGALITAVGIKDFTSETLTAVTLVGYIVMRVGMIALWLRAARGDVVGRVCATRYAVGILICQIIWALHFAFTPRDYFLIGALPIILLEMLVPNYAERAGPTPWHRHHIIERYGLLTIIVLGESLFAAAAAIGAIAKDQAGNIELWATAGSCFVILFAMWWIYFGERQHAALATLAGAFGWGYGHYFLFASVAAVGAGVGVTVDQLTHHAEVTRTVANAAVAAPAALYLLVVWFVHDRSSNAHALWQLPLFALLVLLTPVVPFGVPLAAALLVTCLIMRIRDDTA